MLRFARDSERRRANVRYWISDRSACSIGWKPCFGACWRSADVCGIAGYFGRRTIPSATAERMIAALRQRGPDAEHSVFWTSDFKRTDGAAPNALLHTRLSIIDPRPIA